MKWLILILLLINSTASSFAEEKNQCFKAIQKHILEAIEHNKKVSNLYSELSKGESKRLSNMLITLERISKLLVKNIDQETKIYQEKGIAILCDELADMEDLPKFQERIQEERRPSNFFHYDYKSLSQNLRQLIEDNKFNEAYQTIALDLQELEAYPHQLCLTRHFLESIAVTIKLSAGHREEAQKLGLPDPIKTIKKFITLQRRGLIFTHYLDSQAFPLQKEGLLIYCQDVPVINWKY